MILTVEIPSGLHRLTLYFMDWDWHAGDRPRAHRVLITNEAGDVICSSYVSAFGDGVYKVYGIAGRVKVKIKIQKDQSVCSGMSGLFLDEVSLPMLAGGESFRRFGPEADDIAAAQKNADLKQALALYDQLCQRSKTSAAEFITSAEQMNQIVSLTDSASKSTKRNLASVAAWLRWQCANSLVVSPGLKEESFDRFLSLQPKEDTETSRERVRDLLKAGEVGLAKRATEHWLALTEKEGAKSFLAAFHEALPWFAKRDGDFASALGEKVAQTTSLPVDAKTSALLGAATEMMASGKSDADGPLHSKCAYRVATGLYRAIEEKFGDGPLGDEGTFHMAQAGAHSPGYYFSASKRGIEAYQRYLQHYPEGRFTETAHLEIINLAGILAHNQGSLARYYAEFAAASARAMLDAASPRTGFGPAAAGAYQVGEIYARAGDSVEASRWYEEVVKRIPKTPLGQQAGEKLKK